MEWRRYWQWQNGANVFHQLLAPVGHRFRAKSNSWNEKRGLLINSDLNMFKLVNHTYGGGRNTVYGINFLFFSFSTSSICPTVPLCRQPSVLIKFAFFYAFFCHFLLCLSIRRERPPWPLWNRTTRANWIRKREIFFSLFFRAVPKSPH
jgi:hypothetical protein